MTHEEAVAVMDQAFGVGAAEAHKLIETDAGVKAVYDSALVALIAVSQAKSPTDMAETPAPQAHVAAAPIAWVFEWKPKTNNNPWQTDVSLRDPRINPVRDIRNVRPLYPVSPETNVLVPPIIGETIENLTQLGKYTHDIETRHIQADDLLCDVIAAMVPGGQRIVDAFKAIRKVYA